MLVIFHWRLFWHSRLSVQIRMKWVSYAYYNWWIPYGMMSVRVLSSCQNEINSPVIRMKMKQYLMSIVELPWWKCNPDWQHVILFNLRIARDFSDLFFNLKYKCPLFNKSGGFNLKDFFNFDDVGGIQSLNLNQTFARNILINNSNWQ